MSSWTEQQDAKATEHAWVKDLHVGDVLRTPSGMLRVVRMVRHSDRGQRGKRGWLTATYVAFTIRHCSWTGRCYTNYNGGELVTLGFRPAGVRVKEFKSELDLKINNVIAIGSKELHCCDVRGIA